jgi:SAM-dependent methyltransferase
VTTRRGGATDEPRIVASIRRRLGQIRHRFSSPEGTWQRGLPLEVDFWADYLRTRGGEYPEEFQHRTDPNNPVDDPFLLEAIDRVGGEQIKIVDVGSGPLTSVGTRDPRHPQRRLEVTAVDPLAHDYQRLLLEAGVTAPAPPQVCRGEDVARTFGRGHFDIAYARNSIDHSVDALAAIASMLDAVRVGGAVVLLHRRREGEHHGYTQLHQWNLDVEDGRLVLFNQDQFHDVSKHFAEEANVTAELIGNPAETEWLAATLIRTQR